MKIHKIKPENASTERLVAGSQNSARRIGGQIGEPLKEKMFRWASKPAIGIGIGLGIGFGVLMTSGEAVAQNIADSSNVTKTEITTEQSGKKTIEFESSRALAYEYMVCHSGKKITLPAGLESQSQNQEVWGVTLFGSFELKMADGSSELTKRLIIFEDKIAWQYGKTAQWQAVPRAKVDAVGMLKTEYEIKIHDDWAAGLKLIIRNAGATSGDNTYGTISFARRLDSLGIGEFSEGWLLEQMKKDGKMPGEPMSENMWDGYPQYKPEWKEIRIALPKETSTAQ